MTASEAIEKSWIAYLIASVKKKKARTGKTWDAIEMEMGYSHNHLGKHLSAWSEGRHGMTLATAAKLYNWSRK